MTRVSVPDDYDARDVPLPESGPIENLRNYTGRVAQVREDSDGRYVGVPSHRADAVRAFLGTDEGDTSDSETADDSDGDTESSEDTDRRGLPAPEDTADTHWQTVTGAIEEGAYDDVLDVVAEHESRESVLKAVAERRDELDRGD